MSFLEVRKVSRFFGGLAAIKDVSTLMDRMARGEGAIGSLTTPGGDAQVAIADFREAAASLRRTSARRHPRHQSRASPRAKMLAT